MLAACHAPPPAVPDFRVWGPPRIVRYPRRPPLPRAARGSCRCGAEDLLCPRVDARAASPTGSPMRSTRRPPSRAKRGAERDGWKCVNASIRKDAGCLRTVRRKRLRDASAHARSVRRDRRERRERRERGIRTDERRRAQPPRTRSPCCMEPHPAARRARLSRSNRFVRPAMLGATTIAKRRSVRSSHFLFVLVLRGCAGRGPAICIRMRHCRV
ncbi:hypothetical protein BTL_1372 [Burkholderia thailandensis H0587]|nr:hypothetical protein BTL_1372 [Burkholderia thailandensis H0587]